MFATLGSREGIGVVMDVRCSMLLRNLEGKPVSQQYHYSLTAKTFGSWTHEAMLHVKEVSAPVF